SAGFIFEATCFVLPEQRKQLVSSPRGNLERHDHREHYRPVSAIAASVIPRCYLWRGASRTREFRRNLRKKPGCHPSRTVMTVCSPEIDPLDALASDIAEADAEEPGRTRL